MPAELKGSCHCGAVKFTIQSSTPSPYQLCVCSICRKVGGYGGTINLGAHSETLKVEGKENINVYRAIMDRGTSKQSTASSERNFCSKCSAMLWLYDDQWPELIMPFASAIDSELTGPEEMVVVKTDSKPEHVRLPEGNKKTYRNFGPLSVAEWHKEHGLWVE